MADKKIEDPEAVAVISRLTSRLESAEKKLETAVGAFVKIQNKTQANIKEGRKLSEIEKIAREALSSVKGEA